jgi:hypothetical protein
MSARLTQTADQRKQAAGSRQQAARCTQKTHAEQHAANFAAGRGTRERTLTRMVIFGREKNLESYAVSGRNNCLERKKTPQNGNQISP